MKHRSSQPDPMRRGLLAALAAGCLAAPAANAEELRSGYTYMEPATQALQDDDFLNPGFFLVEEGLALWQQPMGAEGLSCADCHGPVEEAMRGVAARYPLFAPEAGRVLNLDLQIQSEVADRMQAPALAYDSPEILALTALISLQSRGMEMRPEITPQARPVLERGRALYETRRGQLNLSCAQCHDDNAGLRLRGDVISQGHVNAFPIYRLTWGEPGSRHRMFEWCMKSIRAEPFDRGSEDFVALELFLAERGAGLEIEAPGVRR
ncbi:sulfur oxidation c-type cytochrome SoxA [Sinisalibacter lacisalsi]|uniref:SoxAX cytochrome complex subunit A n=1 Tax=Sinisalibacter lacisalsi TaxID=1526570 RepID=A0ABQ1QR45_9RHOB|nr:sulfur oxidation c-type cytochrome SoxA [Sinisalibacter lacisalsi]GGD41922.1 SoxAX cytochrome complex subunit A [Sinisalibacter lacisalsi]